MERAQDLEPKDLGSNSDCYLYVALGKSFIFLSLQFPPLKNEGLRLNDF